MPDDRTPEEITRSHRWHAIECNNLAWGLAESAVRTPQQDEEMLHAAHAAAFHWAKVGTELNVARAHMLLGLVHAQLGWGTTALVYARRSFDYLLAHDPPDWEAAFAHAVLAHAACAAGDTALHLEHYARADAHGAAIADPADRDIFMKTFVRVPRPAGGA